MCAYILKTDVIDRHVDGVERVAKRSVIASPRGTGVAKRSTSSASSSAPRRVRLGGTLKRIVDVLGASIGLVLLAPLMLMVAVLIRTSMGGSALFAQRRVGFDGETFLCYKFRTMVPDAERVLGDHLSANLAAAREWRETCKLKNDPRVTRLGNILRKSSIDELPQLFNVLRGDMSLVGPRPVLPDELRTRYGHYARAYVIARPGLTGMWQASGRNRVSYAGRIARDCYYARNWSLTLDLRLLLKTVLVVMNFDETA